MKIFLNGEQKNIEDYHTAESLLRKLGLLDKRIALEINREIISRSIYSNKNISENDRIEIIKAVGGG